MKVLALLRQVRVARRIRLPLLALALGGLAPGLAHAVDCQPEFFTAPRVIPLSADGSLTYTVRITCNGTPTAHSSVVILLTPEAEALICWCAGSAPTQHQFQQYTDSQGYARFNLRGGGCLELGNSALPGFGHYAAEVFADFVKLAECGTVSPDAVDDAGRLPTDTPGWNPGAVCTTGLADAVFHTTPLANGTYSWCSDLNGDRAVTLSDGIILTPSLANATTCPR